MGKGDKKSRRGKITMGSYGVSRPRKQSKKVTPVNKADKADAPKKEAGAKKAAPKKAAAKKSAKKTEE